MLPMCGQSEPSISEVDCSNELGVVLFLSRLRPYMQLSHLLFSFLCLPLSAAHATDLYRWVDVHGQTQMSDIVPDRYRDVASKISSKKFELTPEQSTDAQARLAKERERSERAKAELDARERLRLQQRADAEAELAKVNSAKKSNPSASNSGKKCDSLWKEYLENAGCFSRFATVSGAVRPEAFAVCSDTPSPAPKCQARTIPSGADPAQ